MAAGTRKGVGFKYPLNITDLLDHRRLVPLTILLIIINVLLCKTSLATSSLNYTKYRQVISSLRLARIQRHLDKINKPPVFTIQVLFFLYIYHVCVCVCFNNSLLALCVCVYIYISYMYCFLDLYAW